jgi:hypothetical protein
MTIPCDSVQTTTFVAFEGVKLPRLAVALRAEGWSVTTSPAHVYAFRNGETFTLGAGDTQAAITLNRYGSQSAVDVSNEVRRAYNVQTVREQTKRFGYIETKTVKTGQTIKMTFGRK